MTFVPLNLGSSGSPVEGFYGANYTQNVLKAAASEFANFIGDAIITSESSSAVFRMHWNGTDFEITQIGVFPNQPEDGIFVTSAIVAPCGNSALDPSEQCDDGNRQNGDCCSSTCQYEASGSPCPADGNPCTDDVCDGSGTCGVNTSAGTSCTTDGNPCTVDACDGTGACLHQPPTGCRLADKSILLLKNNATDDTKDKLVWKWLKGAETSRQDLGVPTGTTSYTLCVYAGTASATIALPGGSNWQTVGSKGFKYKDKSGTPDGAQKALLKSGDAGKAKALVKGKGTNLPDTLAPKLPLPVTAQLMNDTNSTCFEAVYDSGDVIKNDAKQFKAKTQ